MKSVFIDTSFVIAIFTPEESIEEHEDGSITVDPLALAGNSMDHLSQLSGLLKWIRF